MQEYRCSNDARIICVGIIYPGYRCFVCFFELNLYVPSTIFQLYRDGSSWIEPVLSKD